MERFSVIKTLQAIDSAHVVIALLDAQETVAEQDASLLGLAVDRGRALVIGVNKWDALPAEQRELIRSQLAVRLAVRGFRSAALHLRAPRQRGRGADEIGARGVSRLDARDRDARAHAHAGGCARGPPAAVGSRPTYQVTLCPSGRAQPARHRDPRQPDQAVFRKPTDAISSTCFARPTACRAHRCASNFAPTRIPTRDGATS